MPRESTSKRVFATALCAIAAAFVLPGAASGQPRYQVLYSFCAQASCTDGSEPNSVTEDSHGNLFGTATLGGAYGGGVVFKLVRKRSGHYSYKVIYNFCKSGGYCTDGEEPSGALVLDTAGNLYGLNWLGGGFGQAYELSKGTKSWRYHVLYGFCGQPPDCTSGAFPYGSLTYAGASSGQPWDGTSPLYGDTFAFNLSQPGGGGTVFELQPGKSGWQEQVLYDFCSQPNCADGAMPNPSLVEDSSGNLFGTMEFDGEYNYGAVFKLSPNGTSWNEAMLYDFCQEASCADGENPAPALAIDSSGTLYGGTSFGGYSCSYTDAGCGVAFKLVPGTAQESVLHTFCETDCSDGYDPAGNVVLDGNGDVFGTTEYGGDFANQSDGAGTLIEVRRGKTVVLHQFCGQSACSDGSEPTSLMRARSGHLFGTTYLGGTNNKGVIFELVP